MDCIDFENIRIVANCGYLFFTYDEILGMIER